MRVSTGTYVILFLFWITSFQVWAGQQKNIELPSGTEVLADVYGNDQTLRVLWIASSFGTNERHRQMAKDLARQKMQVWQVDLSEALFLPHGAPSSRNIPGELVAELINHLAEKGKHRILMIGSAYGAIPVLRGARAWQAQHPVRRDLIGSILFSPYLFTHVPDIGDEPELVLEVQATSIPIYIFQAEKNTNRWHLPAMLKQLRKHAMVYTEIMQGTTSIFYMKDTSKETLEMLSTIPLKIPKLIPLLQANHYPLKAVALPNQTETKNKLGLDDKLKPYRGKVTAQAVSLKDVTGKQLSLTNYQGKVTIINFWATWCPPCVVEIPSLNNLRQKMQGKPFQLISVNYGESEAQVRKFMKSVAVDFPVLIDPDGKTAGNWKVVAFPSTFVIGPDGRIRYGVNAAIHWDTDDVIRQLNELLK